MRMGQREHCPYAKRRVKPPAPRSTSERGRSLLSRYLKPNPPIDTNPRFSGWVAGVKSGALDTLS